MQSLKAKINSDLNAYKNAQTMNREKVWQNASQIVAEYSLLECDRSMQKLILTSMR
jgi:hypothetical protein